MGKKKKVLPRDPEGPRQINLPVMMGTLGLYLEINLAESPLVLRTRIAPAFCSLTAATAAIPTVSAVGVGRAVASLSSSNKGG